MCEYCGCQDVDVIAELTREHDQLRELGRELAEAADNAQEDAAAAIAASMLDVLSPHTRVEEGGLFPAMSREFADHVAGLAHEHTVVHATLTELAQGTPSPQWRESAHEVVATLFEHILKEQDGAFPAALSILTPDDWDLVDACRIAAHPEIAGTDPADDGGDPACWLHLVCPQCGRMREDPTLTQCANCGFPIEHLRPHSTLADRH